MPRLRDLDLEPIRYSLMCGCLISLVTLLVTLPGTWDLPWRLVTGYQLTHGGVHVEVPLEGQATEYGHATSKGRRRTFEIPVLLFHGPDGKPGRLPAGQEQARRMAASGKVPLVHPAGAPARYYLEGREWDEVGWKLGLLAGVGLAPLWFALFLCMLHVGAHLLAVWRASGSPPGS